MPGHINEPPLGQQPIHQIAPAERHALAVQRGMDDRDLVIDDQAAVFGGQRRAGAHQPIIPVQRDAMRLVEIDEIMEVREIFQRYNGLFVVSMEAGDNIRTLELPLIRPFGPPSPR
jgi:hypothetical protein